MKNNTKGFIAPLLISIIVILAVGGVYLYNHNSEPTIVVPIEEVNSNSNTTFNNQIKSTTTASSVSKTNSLEKVVVKQNADQKNESPIILSVTTDKTEYTSAEPIIFTLTAHNSSTSTITLYFNSGCETFYIIEKFNSGYGRACTANISSYTILPNEKHVWTFTHIPSAYKLSMGEQKINVGINASGKNPFSGEILTYKLPLVVSTTVKISK